MIPNLREWIEKQGFSLEMRTASAFRKAGFEVRQSSCYIDPETSKPREIDVLAKDPDLLGVVNIAFAVECKSSTKPWVLLCSPDTLSGYNRLFAFASTSENARRVMADRISKLMDRFEWLRKDGLTGYSARQAFSDVDVAYAAAIGVTKACNALLRQAPLPKDILVFAFPIIVIDGPLIRCSLSENGETTLEEVDEGEFLFAGYAPHEFGGTCIRVITANHATEFAKQAKQVADQLRLELKAEQDTVLESWRKRR